LASGHFLDALGHGFTEKCLMVAGELFPDVDSLLFFSGTINHATVSPSMSVSN
jgi:hypothetical protein